MNFSSGLILTQMATADSLMELLTNSDKTAKTLKELKQEQAKLSKLKKEVLEGKTLAAYKKKVEGELDELVVKQEEYLAATIKDNKDIINEAKKATRVAKAASTVLVKKQIEDMNLLKKLKEKQEYLEAYEKQLDRQQASVDKQKEYANSLKDEYTDKLVDIKERLRGL